MLSGCKPGIIVVVFLLWVFLLGRQLRWHKDRIRRGLTFVKSLLKNDINNIFSVINFESFNLETCSNFQNFRKTNTKSRAFLEDKALLIKFFKSIEVWLKRI